MDSNMTNDMMRDIVNLVPLKKLVQGVMKGAEVWQCKLQLLAGKCSTPTPRP